MTEKTKLAYHLAYNLRSKEPFMCLSQIGDGERKTKGYRTIDSLAEVIAFSVEMHNSRTEAGVEVELISESNCDARIHSGSGKIDGVSSMAFCSSNGSRLPMWLGTPCAMPFGRRLPRGLRRPISIP